MATIGDLVVNLGLNRQDFTAGIQKTEGTLRSFVGRVGKVLAPLAAGIGAALGTQASVDAARVQIAAERKLEAVIRATGGAAELSADQIKAYASELQGVTNFGDEATIAAAGVLATFKAIKGDTFKDTLAIAQDMSAVIEQDMKSSIVQLGKALNDPIRGVSALSDVGVSFTEQQREQIQTLQESGDVLGAQQVILKELQSEFGGAAAAMADPMTQATNTLGDIGEMLGFVVLPSIRVFNALWQQLGGGITANTARFAAFGERAASGLTAIINHPLPRQFVALIGGAISAVSDILTTGLGMLWDGLQSVFGGLLGLAGQVFPSVGSSGGAMFGSLMGWATDFLVVGQFTFANWQQIAELAFAQAMLAGVRFFNQTVHFLTEVLPTVASWFGENFSDIWRTALDFGLTVLINFGRNVRAILSEVWDFIASGGTNSIDWSGAWQPLTDGFVNSIKELPQIPERQIGALEASLQQDVDRIGSSVSSDLGEFFAGRKAELSAAQVTLPEQTPLTAVAPTVPGGEADAAGGSSRSDNGPAAALAGTRDAFSSILSAMRGGDVADKQLAVAKQQLTAQQELNRALTTAPPGGGDDEIGSFD